MFKKIALLCFLGFVGSAASARADLLFTGTSGNGYCCFNVDLKDHADSPTTITANQIQVTVTLTDGATWFVDTGSGQHPGFAFNIAGDPTIAISNISSPWTSSDVHLSSITTGGPSFGTFDYYFDNPGTGASAHNAGPLVFDVNLTGITYSSFVVSDLDYYFVADIMDAQGQTGMSGIPGKAVTPEPSSLMLLGTGILGAASMFRRRIVGAVSRG
jgi:hypothetical protein